MQGRGAIAWTSRKQAALLIMPAVVAMVLLTIVPLAFLWYVSLTSYSLVDGWDAKEFVGLDNFWYLLSGADQDFWHSVGISLAFTALATGIELLLGFGIALLYDRELRLKPLWISLLIIPLTITPTTVALMWKLMLNTEYGVLNYLLTPLGIKVNWLGPAGAFWSLLLVDMWQWTPFMALIIYAGLKSLPNEPFEAARIDGASSWQALRYVTAPLLRPIITIAVLLRAIDAMKIFDVVYGLTRGGPGNATEVLSLHVYRLGFEHTGFLGRASAAGVILALMASVVATVLLNSLRRQGREETAL